MVDADASPGGARCGVKWRRCGFFCLVALGAVRIIQGVMDARSGQPTKVRVVGVTAADAPQPVATPATAGETADEISVSTHGAPASAFDEGIAVIVPGMGRGRTHVVESHVRWLERQGLPFECWIYVYDQDPSFPANPQRFWPCEVVRHRGHWMDHMQVFPLGRTRKRWVLHILDSIEPLADVNLTLMMRIAEHNRLGHVSPTFWPGSACGKPPYTHPVSVRNRSFRVGRFVDFIELQLDLFTRAYFECIVKNIDSGNGYGWGMDMLLYSMCGGCDPRSPESRRVPLQEAGGKGALDRMTMCKRSSKSYDHTLARKAMKRCLEVHKDAWPSSNGTTIACGSLKAPT